MPELPEIETIKRGLESKIKGKKIRDVIVNVSKLVKEPSLVEFVEKLKDRIIKKVTRRGKYIITYLDSKEKLVIHLGMTGLLIYPYNKNNEEIMSGKIKSKHNHIIFNFTDNSQLVFNDIRRFGKVYLVSDINKIKGLFELGFEPLDDYFTEEAFIQILNKKKKGKIKPFLMNQKFITGLGNIYTNEVLYRSGIHPLRIVSSLNKEEVKKLYQQIRVVLNEAIKLRGSTVADEAYYDTDGRKGEFVKKLQVYGREGRPCIKCGSPIEVIRINSRSSFICPRCQKL